MNQSHYHPSQPGQYPAPQPPTPPRRRMPAWAWVLVILFGAPAVLVGGIIAIGVGAGLAGSVADDPTPVISTQTPEAPVETYDPGIQTPPTETKPTPQPTKPVEKVPSFLPEDGTLLVGKDVKPGTYQTRVVEGEFLSSCYWARLDASGEIIDNQISTTVGARMTLKIRATDDAVEINCYGAVWKRVG